MTRWADYVIRYDDDDGALQGLLEAAGRGRRTMYILGVGFDPRCLVGLQEFLATGEAGDFLILRVELPPPGFASDPAARALADDNDRAFIAMTADFDVRSISFPRVNDRANAGPQVARELVHLARGEQVGHLVVDISSLPSSVFFPMIKAVLLEGDDANSAPGFPSEVQIVACENPKMDAAILETGVAGASVVGGFRDLLPLDSDAVGTRVWAPVVGEKCGTALQAVHNLVRPAETCPVLPFPARNPRRADDLILEHQRELIDEFQVSPGNVIYADERNPFDLYRALSTLHQEYQDALGMLGPFTLALSSHSSKLLSVGVLLAAYERKLPIIAAPGTDYEIAGEVDLVELSQNNELACIWLCGEPYAA